MADAPSGGVTAVDPAEVDSGADRRTEPPRRQPLELALTLLFAAGGWAIGLRPLSDNSFFTHLATGRLLLEDGVPVRDPYSFTAIGSPWTVQSWLASAYWAVAERIGGLATVRLATALLTAVLGALVWTLTRRCESLVPRIGLAAVGLGAGAYMWSSRPLLFGLIFLALVVLQLEGRLRAVWLLPIMVVWTHTHGSFPLGLVAIGAFGLGRAIDDRSLPRAELTAFGWAALGVVAGAIGPDGVDRLTFPVRLLGRSEHLRLLVEWYRPSIVDPWVKVFALQAAITAVALWRVRTWRYVVPSLVFVGLALSAQRNIPSASLVLLPVAAAGLPRFGRMEVGNRPRFAPPIALASVGLMLFSTVTQLGDADIDLRTYPVDALSFVAPVVDAGGRVVTDETTGNLLTLLEGPDWPVAIDDRIDMYPPEVVDDYLVLLRGDDEWSDVLDRWEVDAVVWDVTRPLAGELATSSEWEIVYDDGAWLAACRRGAEACATLT